MIYTISINIRSVFEFSTRTITVHACNYLRQMVNSSLVKFLGGTRYFQFWSSSDVIRFLCRSLRQWVSNSLADTNLMSQKVQLKSSSSTKHGHISKVTIATSCWTFIHLKKCFIHSAVLVDLSYQAQVQIYWVICIFKFFFIIVTQK